MNSVKILFFTFVVFMGLHFSVIAMESKEIIGVTYNNWPQAVADLSNKDNWNDKDLPTNQWMNNAAESAAELIESNKGMRNKVVNDLNAALRKHYTSSTTKQSLSAQISVVTAIKNNFLNKIDNVLSNNYQQWLQQEREEERFKKEIAQQLKRKHAQEQILLEQQEQGQQISEKKKEVEPVKIKYDDIAWKTDLGDFSKDLLNLSQAASWHEDVSIKEGWMEKSVPTQEWMEKAAQSAIKLIKAGRVTPNQILMHLDRALSYYYDIRPNKFLVLSNQNLEKFILKGQELDSEILGLQKATGDRGLAQKIFTENKSAVDTIALVTERFSKLLDEKYLELLQPKRVQEKQKVEEKSREVTEYSLEEIELLKQQFSENNLVQSLMFGKYEGTLAQGLLPARGPSEAWQKNIIDMAITVINSESVDNKNEWVKYIFYEINRAIDNYIKTLWFPMSKQATVAIKYNIMKNIDAATIGQFKNFIDYCKSVANSQVDTNNTADMHWIYNSRKSYFDLNSNSLKKITDDAVQLIKSYMIPISVIEYTINKELQEARKGQSPKLRSAEGLGIMKEIKNKIK